MHQPWQFPNRVCPEPPPPNHYHDQGSLLRVAAPHQYGNGCARLMHRPLTLTTLLWQIIAFWIHLRTVRNRKKCVERSVRINDNHPAHSLMEANKHFIESNLNFIPAIIATNLDEMNKCKRWVNISDRVVLKWKHEKVQLYFPCFSF